MERTRLTIVLDLDHQPEADLPIRAAKYLERALGDVEGVEGVSVVRGEIGKMVWSPPRPHPGGTVSL